MSCQTPTPKRLYGRMTKGEKNGRLTAIIKVEGIKWWFICDCGEYLIAEAPGVRYGNTRSCGCHRIIMGKTGKDSWAWKNSKQMAAIHFGIRQLKPKPELCEFCKKELPKDLANISQEYKRDVNDYEWLCRRCHQEKDGRRNKLKNLPHDKLGRFISSRLSGGDQCFGSHWLWDLSCVFLR